MTNDLDQQLTRLLSQPAALEVDPDMLPAILSRRSQLVRRRRLLLAAGALAAVSVLTVSAVVAVAARSGTRTEPASRPATSHTAVPLLDCGVFALGQGDTVVPTAALTCFLDAAHARTPAVLSESRPTTEGDPIRWTYTVEPDGRVTVLTDSRQDKFGPRQVTVATCTGPAAVSGDLTFSTCTSPVPTTAP